MFMLLAIGTAVLIFWVGEALVDFIKGLFYILEGLLDLITSLADPEERRRRKLLREKRKKLAVNRKKRCIAREKARRLSRV